MIALVLNVAELIYFEFEFWLVCLGVVCLVFFFALLLIAWLVGFALVDCDLDVVVVGWGLMGIWVLF